MSGARRARKNWIRSRLTLRPRDGGCDIVLSGVVVARLRQFAGSGGWLLEWRRGGRTVTAQLGSAHVEHAEAWAVEQLADRLTTEWERR